MTHQSRTAFHDPELLEDFGSEPDLLALADAISATQQAPRSLYHTQLRDAIERKLNRRPRLRVVHPRSARLAIPTLAVLAAATTAVVLGLTLSAASPQSAYAAVKKALSATEASSSGTMTSTFSIGNHTTHQTTQWNGTDLSISGDDGSLWGATQVLLVEGNVYLRQPDGTWLHYANESDAGRLALPLQMARVDVAGSSGAQIVALVPDLQKTVQPDGSAVYTGTIPASDNGEVTPSDNTPTHRSGLDAGLRSPVSSQFNLTVGSDGLVQRMSETADDGTRAWNVQYTQLGSTSPITAPANSTDVTSGTPTPGQGNAPTLKPGQGNPPNQLPQARHPF